MTTGAGKRPFAVFDIDGTLIRWQLYHAVVDRLAKNGLLGDHAKSQLHEARMKWKRREHIDSFKQYERALIAVWEAALPNLTPAQFDEAVVDIASEYKEQVYTYTRDLIHDLKKQGYLLFAISGSHQEVVQQVADIYGFDDVIGTVYMRRGNAFTGEKIFIAHDKTASLKTLIAKHQASEQGSIAVGDSGGDITMLESVEKPIAFNPDRVLFAKAKAVGWHIVVERKNVVYSLEDDHGKYFLA